MPERPDLSNFVCTKCGDCCRWPGNVLLSEVDISRLASFLELEEGTFIQKHTIISNSRRGLSLKERGDGACEFLIDDTCSVYEARPAQCREFPFTWGNPFDCPAVSADLA